MNRIKLAHSDFFKFGLIMFLFTRKALFLIFFLCFFSSVSCSGKIEKFDEAELIEKLNTGDFSTLLNPNIYLLKKLKNTGDGTLYFVGLYLKNDPNSIGSAKKIFKYSVKNEVAPYNKLSRDELYLLSSNDEKLKILEDIISDETVSFKKIAEAEEKRKKLLLLLKTFNKLNTPIDEYLANQKMDNELASFLTSFCKTGNELFKKRKKTLAKDFAKINEARVLTFKRKYTEAWDIFKFFLEDFETYPYISYRNILSEIGQAAIFGSTEYEQNAKLFELNLHKLEKKSFNPEFSKIQKYFFAFYSARLYLKASGTDNVNKAIDLFKQSIEYAPSNLDFDVSIWYILDVLKNKSFDLFLEQLCEFAPKWKDGYFYERLVAYTCMKLVADKDVNKFRRFKQAVDQTKLVEAQARNAYILARLSKMSGKAIAKNEENELYVAVCNSEHNFLYYKILASYRLKNKSFHPTYLKKYPRSENAFTEKQSLGVINGLTKYKLYKNIYSFITAYFSQISDEDATKISKVFIKNELYSYSIKLTNFTVKGEDHSLNIERLKLIYPRPYLKIIRKYAKEFEIPEYLLYGLIRSESFFKEKVISRVGAIGLTQLMPSTANDISRRLKVTDYDLNDPDTNIRFGAYYISNMIKRNNGDIMKALFSYNAGYTSVKRWKRKCPGFENDLFLEALSYPETRGYGRSVFFASAMYANLYYGKEYQEVISEFFKF